MTTNKQINRDEISLKELIGRGKEWFHYLLSQWKIILLSSIIGAVLGLAYSFVKKPTYTATLSFAVEEEGSGGGGLGGALGLASSFGINFGGSGGTIFEGANLNELFKSRTMVEKTLLTPVVVDGKQISLAEMYIQTNKWRDGWEGEPEFENIQFLPEADRKNFTRVHDSILGEIHEELSKRGLLVSQKDKKIDIVSIDVFSKSELFSKYFCEALARQVGRFYIETKTKKSRANMAILQRQTDSIRKSLNAAIKGVAVATDNTFGLNPSLNVRKTPSATKQVDVQANTAILTELIKQSELAKVTLRKDTPLIQVVDRPILPLKNNKVGKLKGFVFGGLLAGFLFCIYLLIKRMLNGFNS